ncbi:N-acetylglucosamine-6-phosphate deacetylase [Paenibacillus tarimensis]
MLTESRWRINRIHIVTPHEVLYGTVTVEQGKITEIVPEHRSSDKSAEDLPLIDGGNGYLLPGFIDLHVHGGFGCDFMDASSEAFDTITRFHALNGTTGMLATTMTAPVEAIEKVLDSAADYRSNKMPYAQLLGVHLEGPFISPKWPGAQNPAYIVPPQLQWLRRWEDQWPGLIKQLTLAPETEGAMEFITWLTDKGIIAAAGHTDATYDVIERAVRYGLSHAVHTFNAMTPLHHRSPGTAGAVLTLDDIHAEIIADGHHVHPAVIRLLVRVKPEGKLILITDAMSAAGLGNGVYELGGLAVTVQDGIARLTDGGSLAGSTLTMIEAVRYMLEHTGMSLVEVSRLASANPARRLGIANRTGTIATGKQADLVWTDDRLNIRQTWVNGRPVQPDGPAKSDLQA